MSEEVKEFVSNPYKKEDKKTFGEVVIAQIDVGRKEFSKEMKKGFSTQAIAEGKVITIQIPDQRLVVMQVTKTLHDLLLFYFDEEVKEKIESINKRLLGSGEIYVKRYVEQETNTQLKKIAEKTGQIQSSSLGQSLHQQLMNYQSELYREMFQELILLFKRKNELSGKRMIGYK